MTKAIKITARETDSQVSNIVYRMMFLASARIVVSFPQNYCIKSLQHKALQSEIGKDPKDVVGFSRRGSEGFRRSA